jgi:large subunit ribosomal protein L25
MKTIEIQGSLRTELGKKSSKQIRKIGNVPCVIYGKEKNTHFHAHENSFKALVFTPEAHLVKLFLDDKEYTIVLKDIQFHPVNDNILHADFIEVFKNRPITISIPVRISGNSVGVIAGGKLYMKRRKIKVKGMANDLPEFIPIDITELKIHESLKIGDLSFPGLEFVESKTAMILTIATSRVAQQTDEEIEAEAAEAAETAEGSEAGNAGEATSESPVKE